MSEHYKNIALSRILSVTILIVFLKADCKPRYIVSRTLNTNPTLFVTIFFFFFGGGEDYKVTMLQVLQ